MFNRCSLTWIVIFGLKTFKILLRVTWIRMQMHIQIIEEKIVFRTKITQNIIYTFFQGNNINLNLNLVLSFLSFKRKDLNCLARNVFWTNDFVHWANGFQLFSFWMVKPSIDLKFTAYNFVVILYKIYIHNHNHKDNCITCFSLTCSFENKKKAVLGIEFDALHWIVMRSNRLAHP